MRRAFLAAMLLVAAAQAGERPVVTASFAPGTIPGTVRYQVVLEGVARDDISASLGSLENLQVVAGPLIAREVAWHNGEMAAVTVATWVLRAARPGAIAVGPTRLAFADVSLQTNAVRGGAFRPGFTGDVAPHPTLRLELSAMRVVVGEPFLAEFFLDSVGLAPAEDWEVRPSFPESWSEPLPTEALRGPASRTGTAIGRPVGGWLVIPAHPGPLEIPPATAARAAPRSGVGEDELVGSRAFTSRPAAVEVAPLPPAPAGFFGGVGELTVTRRLLPGRVRQGELAVLEVEVRGRGNFPLMSVPPCQLPAGFTSFPAEDQHAWHIDRTGLVGTRTWRIPLSRQRIGGVVLPAATLVTFRPGSGYVDHPLPALALTVEPAPPANTSGGGADGQPAAGGLSPLWLGGAFLAGAILPLVLLGWRRRRRARTVLPPASDDPHVELASLHDVLERWCLARFGLSAEAGEAALRQAGCAAGLAAETAALTREIATARSSMGLGDAAGAVAGLRERVRYLLGT